MQVFKPTAKALRKRAFSSADDRIVFLGDGSAAVFNKGVLVQSDMLYKRPDSHCEATDEKLPLQLFAEAQELRHIREHEIVLPFEVCLRSAGAA